MRMEAFRVKLEGEVSDYYDDIIGLTYRSMYGLHGQAMAGMLGWLVMDCASNVL